MQQPSQTETQGVGPYSDLNYRNGSDIESDLAYEARRSQEWIAQSDAIQSKRLLGIAQMGAGAGTGSAALSAMGAGPNANELERVEIVGRRPAVVGQLSGANVRVNTRIPIIGPAYTKPDGSPATYSYDNATGDMYWDLGDADRVTAIPKAFKQPTRSELVNDPSNRWAQGPRMGNVLAEFEVLSGVGASGLGLGGLAARGILGFAADTSAYGLRAAYLLNANGVNATGLLGAEIALGYDAVSPSPALMPVRGLPALRSFSLGNAELPFGMAARPTVQWALNPGGVVRAPDEMMAIARQAGVTFPEDVQVFWVKPNQLLNGEGAQAEYSVLRANLGEGKVGNAASLGPSDMVSWDSFKNAFGKVPVRISTDLLRSDEAAIAHLAHESYELNGLYTRLEIQGDVMTYSDLNRLVRPVASDTGVPLGGIANNLHENAWTYADEVILKWRKN